MTDAAQPEAKGPDKREESGMTVVKDKLHPENAAEALAWWDAGESMFTIEMGGLGPSYEQVIHITVFEIIRQLVDKELPEDQDELNALFREALDSAAKGRGLSGAQAGAANQLAYQYLTRPWEDVLNEVDRDRRIQVTKTWPS